MSKFRVTGIAMVPIEVVMEVEAIGRESALKLAELKFETNALSRWKWIVQNSHDDAAVHDFRAGEATPL